MQEANYPVQRGQYPAPGGQYPAPGGQYPGPGGQYPSPGGQYPAPGGQYSASGGQYPSPGGQYPPPGGQYPSPGGQYPPTGGQYPYAQGETDPPVVQQPYGMQAGQYPTPGGQYIPAQGGMYPWPGGPAYGVQGGQYGMQQPPVMAQPGVPGQPPPYGQPAQWIPPMAPLPGCPEGMEYLTQLDQVLVQQETHLLEVLTGWECQNKFKILNTMGQQIYYAFEESDIFHRMCCGSNRGFIYHITDSLLQNAFCVRRDFKCCKGCFCCPLKGCRYYAAVEDRNGVVLGYISNLTFCLSPLFGIFDPCQNLVAEIRGPFCPCQTICCTADIDFPVVDVMSGQEIGVISRQWPGLIKNMLTDSDNFRVTFPINTDVKMKALMLGAVFILDIMLYETKQNS